MTEFNLSEQTTILLCASISFIVALAMNNALLLSFSKIPLGEDGLFGAWIYAIFMLIFGLFSIYIIYTKLQPYIERESIRFTKRAKRAKRSEV
jgi:uncharacterized membrane protein